MTGGFGCHFGGGLKVLGASVTIGAGTGCGGTVGTGLGALIRGPAIGGGRVLVTGLFTGGTGGGGT